MRHKSFVAHNQAPAVVHPRKTASDFPALTITGPRLNWAPALRPASLAALNGRDGRLHASAAQSLAKVLAVVGFVRHQLLRACTRSALFLRDTHGRQGGIRQLALVGLGTVYVQANRQAMTISHDHHFTALTDLRFADPRSPFFAGTKLPSRKARVHSSLPWASSWLNSTRQICSHVPSAAQWRKRRQHVAGEPHARGTSSRVQPVFITKRMPLSVWRSWLRFRPGPGFCFGIKGSMTPHCSSAMSCRLISPV
jgi:hypothetical protein